MPLRLLAWAGTIIFFILIAVNSKRFCRAEPPAKGILALETANRQKGKAILARWEQGTGNLMAVAKRITLHDFFFIFFYVALLIMLSNNQMYRETWLPLNTLLRLNVPLAIVTGLLDVTENILLLQNIHFSGPDQPYLASFWVTVPKFILVGWIVLVWLVSAIKSVIRR